jgi:beta-lactamase class D
MYFLEKVWHFFVVTIIMSITSHSVGASTKKQCFLVKENGHALLEEGQCKIRHAPCCSFNIAISLMGINEGVLEDEFNPVLPFKKGYHEYVKEWKQPHNPTLWMKTSSLWYTQVITPKIGLPKFKSYVEAFNYGNRDVSGDKGKNNAITQAWLSSSLQISPEEQVNFLQDFLNKKLPVSDKAFEMTKNIIFVQDLSNGWKLYGKTGFCQVSSKKSRPNNEWFVGFIQKGKKSIPFASYMEHNDKHYDPLGREAKIQAIEKLEHMIKVYN